MKIGVRAHDYGKHSIEGLASLLREEGYDGAQLALPKVFEEIDSYEDIRLSHIERIRRAFEKNRVEIPVMGCYMDPCTGILLRTWRPRLRQSGWWMTRPTCG